MCAVFAAACLGTALAIVSLHPAHARPSAAFGGNKSEVSEWIAGLMQPDNAAVSCCGDADLYWADTFEVSPDGEYVAIITDDRGEAYDELVGRVPVPVGTRVIVPNRKLKFDKGNPTGHGVIFLSSTQQAICYVAPGGV